MITLHQEKRYSYSYHHTFFFLTSLEFHRAPHGHEQLNDIFFHTPSSFPCLPRVCALLLLLRQKRRRGRVGGGRGVVGEGGEVEVREGESPSRSRSRSASRKQRTGSRRSGGEAQVRDGAVAAVRLELACVSRRGGRGRGRRVE